REERRAASRIARSGPRGPGHPVCRRGLQRAGRRARNNHPRSLSPIGGRQVDWVALLVSHYGKARGGCFLCLEKYRTDPARFEEITKNDQSEEPRDGDSPADKKEALPAGPAGYPRRALAICVSNYLYANPVSYGEPEKSVHALVERMRRVLHIPAEQVAELSDAVSSLQPLPAGAVGEKPRAGKVPVVRSKPDEKTGAAKTDLGPRSPSIPPTKPVIEKTIGDFLDTSRAQDRVLLLFAGHVIEVEEVPYLVPFEGELTDKDSLIPLSWLYERLAKCKARQKV